MEHQVIEFFPSVCGVYQYPQDKIKDIKFICQKIRDTIKPDLEQMFGKDVTKRILKKLGPADGLSEDKYANVIKAREKAVEDNQWVLGVIDQLEAKLNNEDLETNKQKSWAVLAAEG